MSLIFEMTSSENKLIFENDDGTGLLVRIEGSGNFRGICKSEALALRDYINEQLPSWLSPENDKPSFGEEVLVLRGSSYFIATFTNDNGDCRWHSGTYMPVHLSDLWQPLPKGRGR